MKQHFYHKMAAIQCTIRNAHTIPKLVFFFFHYTYYSSCSISIFENMKLFHIFFFVKKPLLLFMCNVHILKSRWHCPFNFELFVLQSVLKYRILQKRIIKQIQCIFRATCFMQKISQAFVLFILFGNYLNGTLLCVTFLHVNFISLHDSIVKHL